MRANPFPYLLRIQERFSRGGNTWVTGAPQGLSQRYIVNTSGMEVIERVLFAYRIPFLPDFIASPHLAGQDEREHLTEVLNQQARLVASLAKWKNMAFALRCLFQPRQSAVDITVIVRGIAQAGSGQHLAESMVPNITTLLSSFNLPNSPLTAEEDLRAALEPFGQPWVVEIRQREDIVYLTRGDAYVVYPFRPLLSTWISSFQTLVRQQVPCLINVYLEPTQLFNHEAQRFAAAAALAGTMADFTYGGLSGQYRLVDPQASIVSRLYNDYLQRLVEPFLVVVQVASPDVNAALAVAQSLASEISESAVIGSLHGTDQLPCGFDIVQPQVHADLAAAWRTLTALDLHTWGPSEAGQEQERLRYLMDARTASAVFRFPIAVRGGIPGVEVRSIAPDLNPVLSRAEANGIVLGAVETTGQQVTIPFDYFTHQTLITGITGYGKTATTFHLLKQLWLRPPPERPVPFLVLETVKKEYRSLLKVPDIGKDLRVFTLGADSVAPFRFNPLHLQPNVSVESHISNLQGPLEAAFPAIAPMAIILRDSLLQVYKRKLWRLEDVCERNDTRGMPTLGDLYFEMITQVEKRYVGEIRENLRGAIGGRMGSLLRGSLGRMLNTVHSLSIESLLEKPTVLELVSIGDENARATILLLLLTAIREYCQETRTTAGLAHLTVIEEAHNVASRLERNVNREIEPDAPAKGARMIGNWLSEMRGLGEGVLIIDQVPTRLAEDAIKNTNIKIVHRLPPEDDRRVVCATMNATREQENYLTTLNKGQVLFLGEGYERPTIVRVPRPEKGQEPSERIPESVVREHMKAFRAENPMLWRPFYGCAYGCAQREGLCSYREYVESAAYDLTEAVAIQGARGSFENRVKRGEVAEAWREMRAFCDKQVCSLGLSDDPEAAYCYFCHIAAQKFGPAAAQSFRAAAP